MSRRHPTVMVRGEKWRVNIRRNAELRKRHRYGDVSASRKMISVRTDLDPIFLAATVFHEVLHAAAPEWTEEAVCEAEEAFIEVLRICYEGGQG